MTTEARKALRAAIAAQGFHRTAYGPDTGDGAYWEEWGRYDSADIVRIEWSVRTAV